MGYITEHSDGTRLAINGDNEIVAQFSVGNSSWIRFETPTKVVNYQDMRNDPGVFYFGDSSTPEKGLNPIDETGKPIGFPIIQVRKTNDRDLSRLC